MAEPSNPLVVDGDLRQRVAETAAGLFLAHYEAEGVMDWNLVRDVARSFVSDAERQRALEAARNINLAAAFFAGDKAAQPIFVENNTLFETAFEGAFYHLYKDSPFLLSPEKPLIKIAALQIFVTTGDYRKDCEHVQILIQDVQPLIKELLKKNRISELLQKYSNGGNC